MKQFRNYPIYINDSGLYYTWQEQRAAAAKSGNWQKVNELDDAAFRLEITAIPLAQQTSSSRIYERKVEEVLGGILMTDIGRCLFNCLTAKEKIWIVPTLPWTIINDYSYSEIITFQDPPYHGGGIRIHINLKKNVNSDQENPIQIYFHELVHAYRYGFTGNNMNSSLYVATWGGDREEVFATIMQSIYLSCIEEPSVFYSYNPPRRTTPDEAYNKLAFDSFSFDLLTYFSFSDPFAKRAAQLNQPVYNPWRDYWEIKKKSYTAVGRKPPNVFQ